jgi:hypothetical protein
VGAAAAGSALLLPRLALPEGPPMKAGGGENDGVWDGGSGDVVAALPVLKRLTQMKARVSAML